MTRGGRAGEGPPRLLLGMMVGTSCDGVSACLVESHGLGPERSAQVLRVGEEPFPEGLRQGIFGLYPPHRFSARRLLTLHLEVGRFLGEAARRLMEQAGLEPGQLHLVAFQGPILYHDPGAGQMELGEPALVAEATGAVTVNRLRAADAAAGGQGAPLSPYVDYLLFRHRDEGRAVQNLGGIANVTPLFAGIESHQVTAFDTGPANMVIDGVVSLVTGGRECFDRDGRRAARGRVDEALLAELLAHPYFRRPPPKTTGREAFGLPYARRLVARGTARGLGPDDLVATATALTAESLAQAYGRFIFPRGPMHRVILGGGGVRNPTLRGMIARALAREAAAAGRPAPVVESHADHGLPDEGREAITWAILADEGLHGVPANLPSVTGARHPARLGQVSWPPPRGRV
ncbi:anhydro-N-acetylmuramic acid kinase [Limnochorda pilosa]|uniref:anhydro-N-acetylmuramic acid kinase n=1 Tax=Limnochorda pilosa TaxID=1555112 RepID=UPI001E5F14E2|nr:anhydro-N-acetylmuramic acid kinase [Limnochorda pilosa]